MKLLFTLFILMGILSVTVPKSVHSQTLTFSRVILLDSNITGCQTCWTVPAGKVWKIVSFGCYDNGYMMGYLNGTPRGYFLNHYTSSSGYYNAFRMPCWLPSGTVFGYTSGSTTSNWFSIIEFTVTP